MQIKAHVTLQELKDFYLDNKEGLPEDAELVVDESSQPFQSWKTDAMVSPVDSGVSTTCKQPGCLVYHPDKVMGGAIGGVYNS